MSKLAKKVSMNRKSNKALQPAGLYDTSGTSSDSDSHNLERHPSLASPAVGVPEFRNESKRYKVLVVSTAGLAITSMLDHLRFISNKAASKAHITKSLISYDEELRRLAEHKRLSAFSYGR